IQGRVLLWRIVPAGGIHCDEPGDRQPGGRAVLQQTRDGGAVLKRRDRPRNCLWRWMTSIPEAPKMVSIFFEMHESRIDRVARNSSTPFRSMSLPIGPGRIFALLLIPGDFASNR